MLYIGNKKVESAYLGGKYQPNCYLGNVFVYPEQGPVYTYELVNARYEFSNTTTYLMANQGNYAVMVADLKTYKDGKLEKTEKISLSNIEIPRDGDIIIYTDGAFYWNKEKYGRTTKTFGHVSIRGQYSDMVVYADLSYGNNGNRNFDHSVINTLSVDGNTTDFTADSNQHNYDVSITGTRYYKWTSGYDSYNEIITAKREYFSLVSTLVSHGDADSGRRATYGFTNNGTEDITITCVLECTNSWWDSHELMPDSDTVTDTETIVVPAGQTVRQQLQAIPMDPGVTYDQTYTEYFTIEGVSTHYEPGDTITTALPINKDAFAVQLTPTSFATYKDLQLTINKNATTSSRDLIVKAMDSMYTSATKQLTITQEASSEPSTDIMIMGCYIVNNSTSAVNNVQVSLGKDTSSIMVIGVKYQPLSPGTSGACEEWSSLTAQYNAGERLFFNVSAQDFSTFSGFNGKAILETYDSLNDKYLGEVTIMNGLPLSSTSFNIPEGTEYLKVILQ